MKYLSIILPCGIFILSSHLSSANLRPDPLFSDHMVLQCNQTVTVWGKAEAGKPITVEFFTAGNEATPAQKTETTADAYGAWRVQLKPMASSDKAARMLVTDGQASIEIKDVLVGEAWLGSGQSNMAYSAKNYVGEDKELNAACQGGPYSNIRLYVDGNWEIANAENSVNFSALLFSFGHALQHELQTPVGLMYAAVNGTPSGSWMSEKMANDSPELVTMFKQNSGFESFEAMAVDWNKKRAVFKDAVQKADKKDRNSMRFSHPGQPIGYHFKKVEQFIPYSIRGVLWDQGEGGTKIPGCDQFTVMKALITGWRKAWDIDALPFLHMQKPSGGGCGWEPSQLTGRKVPMPWSPAPAEPLPEDRACALNLIHIQMGTIKNAPLVTTSDLTPGIHPVHKYSYGKRACRVALGTVYGKDIVTCGPTYESHSVNGNEIVIAFANIGSGLAFKHGEKLQGFEISGEDLNWVWAENAAIKGDTVVVSNDKLRQPKHVRYAFNQTHPWANLFNKDGLPALMFTTTPPH